MKHSLLALAFAASCVSAVPQPAASDNWIGIWHADTDGLPTGTLTLAADTGQLGGTVVLDMVSREGGQPHVLASEPHVLMNPRVEGNRLSFQVRMQRPTGSIVISSFDVVHTAPDNLTIHCVSCGPDAPVVALVRGQ